MVFGAIYFLPTRMVYREGWIGKNVFAILKAQISIIILSKKLLKIK